MSLRRALLLAIIGFVELVIFQTAYAKIRVEHLAGIDLFAESESEDFSFLNPTNGITFSESGLLQGLGVLDVDGVNDAPTMAARSLVDELFHTLPSGYLPSSGASRLASFLHPELIGSILGKYLRGMTREELEKTILRDSDVIARLEQFRYEFCKADASLNDEAKGTTYRERLERQKLVARVFKDDNFCTGKAVYSNINKLTLKKNFNAIEAILTKEKKNLLVVRALLALLWHKVKDRADFQKYYNGLLREIHSQKPRLLAPEVSLQRGVESKIRASSHADSDASLTVDHIHHFHTSPFASHFYPSLMEYRSGQVLLKQDYAKFDGHSWADCAEVSLRNLARLIAEKTDESGNIVYDIGILHALGASHDVMLFFDEFNDHNSQLTQEARNKWGLLTCNLTQAHVTYLNNFDGNSCEISARSDNVLRAATSLFLMHSTSETPTSWEQFGKLVEAVNPSFKIKEVDFDSEGRGKVKFSTENENYYWNFVQHHTYISRQPSLSKPTEKPLVDAVLGAGSIRGDLAKWDHFGSSKALAWFELIGLHLAIDERLDVFDYIGTQALRKMAFLIPMEDPERAVQATQRVDSSWPKLFVSMLHAFRTNPDAQSRILNHLIESDPSRFKIAMDAYSRSHGLVLKAWRVAPESMPVLLQAIAGKESITDLSISVNNEEDMLALSQALATNRSITSVAIDVTVGTDRGLRAIAASLKRNTHLRKLFMVYREPRTGESYTQATIGSEGAEALGDLVTHAHSLRTLVIQGLDADTKGAAQLFRAIGRSDLNELAIGRIENCQKGIELLAEELAELKSLKALGFQGLRVSEESMLTLVGILNHNQNISAFSMAASGASDHTAKGVAEIIRKTKTLTTLSLHNNRIGDEGAISLAEAIAINASLQHVELSENDLIKDEGRKGLERVKVLRPQRVLSW